MGDRGLRVDIDRLRFTQQFVLARSSVFDRRGHPFAVAPLRFKLDTEFNLITHPDARVTKADHASGYLWCLGDMLDPSHPDRDNAGVLQAAARAVTNFDTLERELSRLSGQWIVIAAFGGAGRVYHDAGGLRGVFRAFDGERPVIGSQPILFERMGLAARDAALEREVRPLLRDSWTPHALPYPDVERMPANHCCDLETGRMVRYWPKRDIAPVGLDEAAERVGAMLRGAMEASLKRGPCVLSLSGGYDSRVLLACAGPLREALHMVTVRIGTTRSHDTALPAELAARLGFELEIVDTAPNEPAVDAVLRENSSGLSLEQSIAHAQFSAGPHKGAIHLQGLVAEVIRSYFGNARAGPGTSAMDILQLARYAPHPAILSGFETWLARAPETTMSLLDLLFWEFRIGIWASAQLEARRAVLEIWPPFNNRELLTIGLGVDAVHRQAPYALFRRMVDIHAPALKGLPYNAGAFQGLKDALPLPWRVKRKLGWI